MFVPFVKRAATVAGALTVGLTLAACGGGAAKTAASSSVASSIVPSSAPVVSSAGGPAGGGPSADPSAAAAFAKYADCLTAHGVTVQQRPSGGPRPSGSFSRPSGSFSPGADGGGFGGFGGPDASANPTVSAARAACASLQPAGGFGGFGPGGGRNISAATFAAFKSCMSDQGVTISTTDPQQATRGLDRTDPKTAAALKVCQPILGQLPKSPLPTSSGAPAS
jgi:hypothetical protein